jgi:hypothetical protein
MSVSQNLGAGGLELDFSRGKVGDYQGGWRALVDGMADKTADVRIRFLQALKEHNAPDVVHASVKAIERVTGESAQTRDYFVVERSYKNGGKCTLAVRIAPYGKDLYVEWLRYELGVLNWPLIGTVGCLGTIVTFGIGLIVFIPLYLWAVAQGNLRRDLTHFERQDSFALGAVVDSSLRQAIDQAGIEKSLVHEISESQAGSRGIFRM